MEENSFAFNLENKKLVSDNLEENDLTNANNISLDEESMNIFDSPKDYQMKIKNPQTNHFNKI